MLWTGRTETMMDGWVKYGTKHAFSDYGVEGQETVSLCGKLDVTNRRDVEECGTDLPDCKICRKKLLYRADSHLLGHRVIDRTPLGYGPEG